MLDFRLDNHTALVTGASRGLGRAIADGLHELGATVYGTSRDEASAVEVAERYGTSPVMLDVSDVRSIEDAAARLKAQAAGVDLLVNNAGRSNPQLAFDVDQDSWDMVHNANVRGLFFTSQAIARGWVADGTEGSIVNIGSQAGQVAIEERAVYGSSKAAVAQLTRNLALEWAPHGIRVNAVAPTFVYTDLTASTLSNGEWADKLRSRIPLGRFGEAEDIVGAVAFLLGSAASLITGQTLLVDGGYTIH